MQGEAMGRQDMVVVNRLAILGREGQGWPQGPSGSTSAQLGLCQSWAGLSSCWAAVKLGAWRAGFLYDANEDSGRRAEGGTAFVLHLTLLEGPQGETGAPLRPQWP